MTQSSYLTKIDDHVIEIVGACGPIRFADLLHAVEKAVGHNRVNEDVLQRRLKILRIDGRIKNNRFSPRGWILTHVDHDHRSKNHPRTKSPDEPGE